VQIDRTRELATWASRVHRFLDAGVDVYGYFNNHFAGHSPGSVRKFEEMLAGQPRAPGHERHSRHPL